MRIGLEEDSGDRLPLAGDRARCPFGPGWPAGVPVQVHGMDADPIFVGEGDVDAARELIAEAEDGELPPNSPHRPLASQLFSACRPAESLCVLCPVIPDKVHTIFW